MQQMELLYDVIFPSMLYEIHFYFAIYCVRTNSRNQLICEKATRNTKQHESAF